MTSFDTVYQRISEGTVVEYSGLEYSLNNGTARIPSVIQLVSNVPSLQRNVRVLPTATIK